MIYQCLSFCLSLRTLGSLQSSSRSFPCLKFLISLSLSWVAACIVTVVTQVGRMFLQHHGFSSRFSSSIVFPSLLTIGCLVLASSRGHKTKESFNQKVARTIRIAANTMDVMGSDPLQSLASILCLYFSFLCVLHILHILLPPNLPLLFGTMIYLIYHIII